MIRTDKYGSSIKYLLATIIILFMALSVCFYIAGLHAKNRNLIQLNQTLQSALGKEQRENADLTNTVRGLERLLQNERAAVRGHKDSSYQKLYPDLKATPAAEYTPIDPKVIYLTFDDGPFAMTDRYLNLLKSHDVKATFFVVGRSDPVSMARMKRMADEGHTVAPHTYTHIYKTVYDSVENYLHDFKRINDLITLATGQKPDILRFPGGSVNVYNKNTYRQIIAEIQRRGYTYYDWSISAGDTAKNASAKSTEENIMRKIQGTQHKIVLMHEGKDSTLEALESLIVKLKKQGYKFEKLTNEVKPIQLKFRQEV